MKYHKERSTYNHNRITRLHFYNTQLCTRTPKYDHDRSILREHTDAELRRGRIRWSGAIEVELRFTSNVLTDIGGGSGWARQVCTHGGYVFTLRRAFKLNDDRSLSSR